jgi:hypothetical protein
MAIQLIAIKTACINRIIGVVKWDMAIPSCLKSGFEYRPGIVPVLPAILQCKMNNYVKEACCLVLSQARAAAEHNSVTIRNHQMSGFLSNITVIEHKKSEFEAR